MIITYGLVGESACAAARSYANRFPGRAQHPSARVISRAVQELRKSGCLVHKHEASGALVRSRVRDKKRVLAKFDEDSGMSVHRAVRELGLSRYAVHRALRQYHQRLQRLKPGDAQQRVNFCKGIVIVDLLYSRHLPQVVTVGETRVGFLAQCQRDSSFTDRILWTNQAIFILKNVSNNSRNFTHQAEDNRHIVHEGAFRRRRSINVWAGMIGNQVVSVSRENNTIFLSLLIS